MTKSGSILASVGTSNYYTKNCVIWIIVTSLKVDFYSFHHRFSIIVISSKIEQSCITFIMNFKLNLFYSKWIRFL